MPPYLSPAWLAALDGAARASDALRRASEGRRLVIEQVVVADEEVRWHVVLDHGTVAVRPGPASAPTVRFTASRTVAERITRGEGSAQGAFMRGELRVGGDAAALVEHAELLAELEDAFGDVRSATTY